MLKLTDYIGLGNAEYSDTLIGLRISTRLHIGGKAGPSYIDVLLSGVSPLALTNALGLNYIKALGATEQRNLPSGYTQVEYLESDGNQYIDTGYAPNVNTEVKINFSTTTLPSTDAYMFHSSDSGKARISLAITQHLVFFGDDLNVSGNRIVLPVFTANTAYNITVNKNTTIVNGTEYNFTHTSVTLPTMSSIGLFGSRTGSLKCQSRVKSFSCNENNVLRINLIPCRRNSDNVLGMYDLVSGTFFTNGGTGSFIAGADVTAPSPDTPIDIICNNGVVKARHHSGLPLEYQRVEYLKSTGTQYIDTGYIANGGMAFEAKAAPGGTRGTYTFWIGSIGVSTENPDNTRNAVGVNGNVLSWQKGRVYGGAGLNLSNNNPVVVYMNTIGNAFEGKANGTTLNVNPSSIQQTLTGLTTTVKIGYSDYSSAARAMTIYYFKMWNNNYELIQNLIPCRRNSDNVLGMYDTVSQTFLTNQGTGTFTAGNTVSDPIEIYTDGTQETVNIIGKNLFDSSVFNTNVGTDNRYVSYQIPNGTYTMSTNFPPQTGTHYTNVWILAGKVTSGIDSTINGVSSVYPRTITVTDGWYTVCYRSINSNIPRNPKDYNWQLEQGSTATTYEPYTVLGTANAEMLLKVGTYQDNQELLTGNVTRNVGIKVLDGTENWQLINTPYFSLAKSDITPSTLSVGNFNSICSHFVRAQSGTELPTKVCFYWGNSYLNINIDVSGSTTVAQFKQYLANQYNAGTPVIIVYPLAEPTTEQVTGQSLTASGNCTVTATGSLDNLSLEVSYKQGVTVRVREASNESLDNEVNVTIS